MKKREKIIGIVMLAAILIWGLTKLPKSRRLEVIKPIAKPVEKPGRITRPIEVEPLEKIDLKRMIEQKKLSSKKIEISSIRDPFMKLKPKRIESGIPDLVLSGVIWEEEEPTALINEQILKKGDKIAGYQIEEIRQDEVVLIKGAERHILKLFTGMKTE